MNKLTLTCAVFLAAFVSSPLPAVAQTQLASLGTNNFNVSVTLTMTPQQSATSLTNVPTIPLGGLFGGSFTNLTSSDWSAYSDTNIWTFGLFMFAPGVNPNVPFTVELYDSTFGLINAYQGTTVDVTSSSSFVEFDTLSLAGSGDFSSVGGFMLTWDADVTSTVVIDGVGVVPEPSTWALLGLGALVTGVATLRRRRKAA
jgi:hypothetical protein